MTTRALIVAAAVAAALLPPPGARGEPSPSLDAYRGLGAWIDIYDPAAWRRPAQVVGSLAARGVKTLYLETTNYHRRGPIFHPGATGRFIDEAHARGMSIVAWYLPGFRNLRRDLRRSMAAIGFRSPSGGSFDSFALDIEATIVKNPRKRIRRALALSRQIRAAVGEDYALGAIIPSPRGMELKPRYWPGFPYARLAGIYDVFLTMTYYSWRAKGPAAVTRYMRRAIDILRAKTGVPNVALHAIGGEADGSSFREGRAFVRVVREYGLLGASLYDDSLMDRRDWEALARVQPNPHQSPAMPFAFGQAGPAGNIPGEDETHPDEVVFRTGPLSGDRTIAYEGFDLGAGEVWLEVNWRPVAALPEGLPGAWSAPGTIQVPGSLLRSKGFNVLSFAPVARHPSWPSWGVRNVQLLAGP